MKIFIVFGTRPEAIKLAPLVYKLRDHFTLQVVSSGQHLELMTQVIDFYKIKPDYSFGCMMEKQDLEDLYKCIHRKMRVAIDVEDPDLIIVQGDTFTTYSAAFVGSLLKKPVFHVEAGLRTRQKFLPFPEEMLRSLVGRLADVHFAPTRKSAENLLFEGVRKDRIFVTGNTIVDAMHLAGTLLDETAVFKELSWYNSSIRQYLKSMKLILVTSHRRENIGDPLVNICRAIKELAAAHNDALFLWPLHKNPDVREIVLREMAERPENIVLTEALSYQAFAYLLNRAFLIMTDSGGIQEEASTIGKPVIILRESTERPEVLESGFGFLAESDAGKIMEVFTKLFSDKGHKNLSKMANPFGDGKASDRILRFLQLDEIREFIEEYPHSSENVLNAAGKIGI